MSRILAVHFGILFVASGIAFKAWTSDADSGRAQTIELWSGKAEELTRVELEDQSRKVVLEARSDSAGRYFVGTLEKDKKAPSAEVHGGHELEEHGHQAAVHGHGAEPEHAEADSKPLKPGATANAASSSPNAPQPQPVAPASSAGASPTEPPQPREKKRFIAVSDAEELAELMVPLVAKRALGRLPEDRLEEFGFAEGEAGQLRISVGSVVHQIEVGGKTPGAGDIYVRKPDGEAYVVAGRVARDVRLADSRLMQRELHTWEREELRSLKIQAGGASRELVQAEGQKSFWASPSDPANKDETASNWVDRFQRLRILKYVEGELAGHESIARVEFSGEDGKPLGFVDLVSRAVPDENQLEYLVRTEASRWYGVVLRSNAEQLAQDLASVLSR